MVKPEEMHSAWRVQPCAMANVLVENLTKSAAVYFPTHPRMLPDDSLLVVEFDVSQFSTTLLLVTALMLTACFGVAAWRTSGDVPEVTGSIASTLIDHR